MQAQSTTSADERPILSLVVASYQRAKPLEVLLKRLSEQTLDNSLWEVIIAVDGSTDETLSVLDRWAVTNSLPLKYFHQVNQGQSVARHQGIEQALGSRVIIIDDDMEPSAYFLEGHLTAGAADPEHIVTIGKVIPQESWREMPLYEV
ncbi:MAG: glycosyltransferase family 2 protein, partial [Proteobacteria bacterium]